ncbi:MAG: PadR family transcriptional regulator [Lachnospiraceae bacterium]|nr:PadR family transcriptional regulator [Lachnospiraceae bacterium]
MPKRHNFISGITDLLVLTILSKGDRYIYGLTKSIQDYSEGRINISLNTVYTVTYKLENENKISEYTKLVGKKRTRVYYHIEEAGRKYLQDLTDEFLNISSGYDAIIKALENEPAEEDADVSGSEDLYAASEGGVSGSGEA